MPRPLGDSRASWSKVRILPPALRMRLRGRLLTRSAHTFSLGTSRIRTSSVTVPTTTAVLFSRPGDHAGQGQRWPVGSAHEQPLQHNLIEGGAGPSGQKPVQLHKQPQVDVLALGLLAPNLSVLVVANVNTLREVNHHRANCQNHCPISLMISIPVRTCNF